MLTTSVDLQTDTNPTDFTNIGQGCDLWGEKV